MSNILVTHDQIKPYVINGINAALAKAYPDSDQSYFDIIEAQAAQILFDRSGYTANDKESIAGWSAIPMAYIIQKLAKNLVSQLSSDISDAIENDYKTALSIIDEHPNESQDAPADKSSSFVGYINNMNEW